jgi:hypothetical protein
MFANAFVYITCLVLRLVLIAIDAHLSLHLIPSMHVKIYFFLCLLLIISMNRSPSNYQIERRIPSGISSRLRLVKRLEGKTEI